MVDKFYMCHYQKLTERRAYVEAVAEIHGIELEWVLVHDKETIDYDALSVDMPGILSEGFGRRLSAAEISLVLKHRWIYEDVVSKGYSSVVVFEDDIILVDGFREKLDAYLSQLPSDFDFLWIGTCCDLVHPGSHPGVNVYRILHGSRCTHAYVISN